MQYLGLYSYPRSGSNWLRLIMYGLLTGGKPTKRWECSRDFPHLTSADLARAKTFRLPTGEGVQGYKCHASNIVYDIEGKFLDTRYYFYISRHPLDVFFSYMKFMHYKSGYQDRFILPLLSVDELVENGSIRYFLDTFLNTGRLDIDHREVGSWWSTTTYWMQMAERHPNIIYIKYEDLCSNPFETLQPIVDILGGDRDVVENVFRHVDKLTKADGKFFWKRRAGVYKDYLDDDALDEIKRRFGAPLAERGYAL